MRVTIAGGHGTIARHLTRLLTDGGHQVTSLVRKRDQFADIEQVGGRPVLVDLEHTTVAQLADAVGDVDAVVFAAGSGPGSGAARKETVDHQGAVVLIEAAKRRNVDQYLMVSSIGANAAAVLKGLLVDAPPSMTTVQLTAGPTPIAEAINSIST